MRPFTRITFNGNNWVMPSGPNGKCPGVNQSNFECACGFGFEEWYRSDPFKDGEWQYGYLQCFHNRNMNGLLLENMSLYTRYCQGGCLGNNNGVNILVAEYKEMHVLNEQERIWAMNQFNIPLQNVRNQLVNDLNIQPNCFDNHGYYINMKFKTTDENYLFRNQIIFPIQQGEGRFRLYR